MLLKTVPIQRWLIRLIPMVFLALFVLALALTYIKGASRRNSFSLDSLPVCGAEVEPAPATRANFSVVLWTNFSGERRHPSFDDSPLDSNCAYTNCEFSVDRELAETADAVVFHQADMSLSDMPATRQPSQRWIFFNLESPPNSLMLSPAYNNIFNWSMTYHSSDDIVVPYFEICRKPNMTEGAPDVDNVASKSWSAVWFVSNCRSPSNRMAYVEELQNYINIDIIGACSPLNVKCPKSKHKSCLDALLPKYKFVLAFENSICSEYVTEKLKNVLPYDVIPIFWGGADYTRLLPRESFVVASDFPKPKDLARSLYRFRSDAVFRKAVAARKGVQAQTANWKCRLCEKLNKSGGRKTVRRQLYQDAQRTGQCKMWRRGHFLEHHFLY